MVVVALVLGTVYWRHAVNELVAMTESQNMALARSFANTLWPRYGPYIRSVADADGDALRARPETRAIHADVLTLTADLPVLKVKIYNLDGLTVYSSEPSQMGDDKSANPGFLKAVRRGSPASKLSYRDTFSALSGVVVDRDLVETFIPIWNDDGRVDGVFELYTDITYMVVRIVDNTTKFVATLLACLAALYGVLSLIVRRADRILGRHYVALRHNDESIRAKNAALSEAHDKLEQRVEERTAELREKEQSLRVARDDAEAASRAKSEFLAAMSHELRTPLNAIIGFSDMIKGETFGPVGSVKYRDYANDINTSGLHLLALINDILDLSKVESGTDELDEEDIEVPRLIRSAFTLVRQRAENIALELDLEVPDALPALRADERKLKQILVNLLSNAIKFTETGGKVTLKAWTRATSGHVFQVIDTGIGIAPEDIPKALSMFGQVDGDLNRQYEGTGLGLPLAKGLVELHGGTLDLQSQVNVGTTVTVRFPASRIIRPGQAAQAPVADERRVG